MPGNIVGAVTAGNNNIGGVELVDPADDTRRVEFDPIFRALFTLGVEHFEVHEGDHYFFTDCVTLGVGGTQEYMLTVPNDAVRKHFIFSFEGATSTTVAMFEGGDRTGTTLQTTYNNDRDSVNTAGLIIHKGTSGGTTDGTDIHPSCAGSNKSSGLIFRDREIMLKTNTKYILKVTSAAASNNIFVSFDWYEHTDE